MSSSAFLAWLSRLYNELPRSTGSPTILLEEEDLKSKDLVILRFRVGMLILTSSPIPNLSIFGYVLPVR